MINLRKIIRSVNLESKRIEKEFGLSIPQLLCLIYLNTKEGLKASHKEIKDYLQLNASTVTGIISRLEKKALLQRLPKQADKRLRLIALTATGKALLDETPDPLHQRLSKKLNNLSPGQLQELEHAFERIIGFLHLEKVDAAPIFTSGADIPDPEQD
ncbi:MAG: MarR family transcriptional regulator [Bacteroidetes bacterium]|nr:MarR family transcriptional regulator [Bacteroidota bacterium]